MSHDGGYVEKVREEMQSYVRTLLADNERVRNLLAALEEENARLSREARLAREEADAHEAHEVELHRKLHEADKSGSGPGSGGGPGSAPGSGPETPTTF